MHMHYRLELLDQATSRRVPVHNSSPVEYLHRLPVELWDKILRLCWSRPAGRRDFNTLPLVCQLFHDVLDPLRFSTLTLSQHELRFQRVTALANVQMLERSPIRFSYIRVLTFQGPDTEDWETASRRSTQPYVTRLLLGLLFPKLPNRGYAISNLTTLRISNCVVDMALVAAMQALSSLSVVHFISVVLKDLSAPRRAANCRISELRFSQVDSSNTQLISLASALVGPHLTSLIFRNQFIPHGVLRAILSDVSPGSIEDLIIEDSYVEPSELATFLESHRGIRNISYNGRFSFATLASSALPGLEQCTVFGTDIEYLIRGRPLEQVSTFLADSSSSIACAKLSALGQSTKPLLRLKIGVPLFRPSLLDAIVTTFNHLEELDVTSAHGVPRGVVEINLIPKIGALRSLKSLSFLTAAGPGMGLAPELEFFHEPMGQLELLWQQVRVKQMEAACCNLRVVNMRPISWIWLSAGEWRPYPADSEQLWDQPLEMHVPSGQRG